MSAPVIGKDTKDLRAFVSNVMCRKFERKADRKTSPLLFSIGTEEKGVAKGQGTIIITVPC